MKRLVLLLPVVAGFAPPVAASVQLGVQIGPRYGEYWPEETHADAYVAPGTGEHFLDLVLRDIGEEYHDHMAGYDVVVLPPAPGLTLLRAEKPEGWAFTDPAATFTVGTDAAGRLTISARSPEESIDVLPDSPKNIARLYYSVDPGAAPGRHDIALENEFAVTRIYSSDPTRFPPTPVEVRDPGTVVVTPEPSGLAAVLAVGGVLALRRRRRVAGAGRGR